MKHFGLYFNGAKIQGPFFSPKLFSFSYGFQKSGTEAAEAMALGPR